MVDEYEEEDVIEIKPPVVEEDEQDLESVAVENEVVEEPGGCY